MPFDTATTQPARRLDGGPMHVGPLHPNWITALYPAQREAHAADAELAARYEAAILHRLNNQVAVGAGWSGLQSIPIQNNIYAPDIFAAVARQIAAERVA